MGEGTRSGNHIHPERAKLCQDCGGNKITGSTAQPIIGRFGCLIGRGEMLLPSFAVVPNGKWGVSKLTEHSVPVPRFP